MASTPEGLGDLALQAAQTGARTIAEVLAGGLRVGAKSSPRDLVTNADRAAERAIVELLRERRPGDALLGEESGEHPGSSGVRWLIDPVDGTTNFVHGRRDYAVAVGVEHDGRAVAGAIVRPAYEDWVMADGEEAYGSAGAPSVSRTAALADALVSLGLPHRADLRPRMLGLLSDLSPRLRDFRRIGSACCDLFSVATGALDAYVAVAPQPWDIGAGWAVVRAAGGRCGVVTTAGGLEVFVAGSPAVAAALEEALRDDRH